MGARAAIESVRTIRLDGPLDLRATLGRTARPANQPAPHAYEAWRAVRTPQGPATTRVQVAGGHVTATAWGPGAEWSLETLPALLGLHDDASAFTACHPLVDRLNRQHPGLRIGRTGLVWEAMTEIILGQKVTTAEANRSWASLVRRYGESAPGPAELTIAPAPEQLAALAYHDLHPHGIERKRAEIIINCARRANRIDEAAEMPVPEAYQRLMAFPGIGIWTASVVLGRAIGDPDAIPIGDYHVPNTVAWALAGEPRGDDARMIELLEPYRGHRTRVVRLLHLGGVSAPKYGPRTQARNIRGM